MYLYLTGNNSKNMVWTRLSESKQLHRLHKRFIMLISVALRHHRNINYIVEKVFMAVQGSQQSISCEIIGRRLRSCLYCLEARWANSSQYFVESQQAFKFFSGLSNSLRIHVYSPVTMSADEYMKYNLDLGTFSSSYLASQKIDEIFLAPRVPYD